MEENVLPNQSLETLFESRWLYIVELDADRSIQRSNTAARELLGIDDDDGRRDIRTTALAALELPAEITEQSLLTRLHGEISQSLEIVTPSGLVRWFEWRVSPVFDDGHELQAFLCIGTDISRRRRAEERIRVFFDESKDMIFSCAPDDRITEVNEAGVRLLGSRNAASLVQRKITDFYVSVADREFYRSRMRADGYVKDLELFMRREDGTRLVVLETSTAVKDSDGNILEYHGIIKDISERIRLEQDHMKMNIELAETNRKLRHTQSRLVQQEKLASVGRLAAGLAHEINNPLSFVKSNLDSLKEYVRRLSQHMDSRNESARPPEIDVILSDLDTLFDESEHGFDRMVSIVQGLRNFARTGKGRREEYSLNAAVETTLAILRNEYKRLADVELHLGEIPEVPCFPDEINQVMLNVLINAIQAIRSQDEEAEHAIRIYTGSTETSVYCRIEDTGPGISAKDMPQIFEPFFTTKPRGEGTGLGLSISYDIVVNKHGGDLSATSLPDGGAAFLIELPRHVEGAAAGETT